MTTDPTETTEPTLRGRPVDYAPLAKAMVAFLQATERDSSQGLTKALEIELGGLERSVEARTLRRVAEALRLGFRRGYSGCGGPRDGPDVPDSFDAIDAAEELEDAAEALETP